MQGRPGEVDEDTSVKLSEIIGLAQLMGMIDVTKNDDL